VVAWIALSLFILYVQFGIHEFGHFHMARVNDVPVKEFSLGIGPSIYQKQAGDTLFSIRIVPLGAYNDFSKEGVEAIAKLPLEVRLLISVMGIVNNLLSSLALIFLIQFAGVLTGRLRFLDFLFEMAVTPFRLFLMIARLFIEILSFGRKTIGVGVYRLPFEWNKNSIFMRGASFFILMGFLLGFSNIIPLMPLDGGRIVLEFLSLTAISDQVLVIIAFSGILACVFIFLTSFSYRVSINFAMFDNQPLPGVKKQEDEKSSEAVSSP